MWIAHWRKQWRGEKGGRAQTSRNFLALPISSVPTIPMKEINCSVFAGLSSLMVSGGGVFETVNDVRQTATVVKVETITNNLGQVSADSAE